MSDWVIENWTLAVVIFYVLLAWSLIWKGIALWKAARNEAMIWYIVLLILNTAGILEILYIFVFSRMGKGSVGKS